MNQRGSQATPTRDERVQLYRQMKLKALSGDSTAALAIAALQLEETLRSQQSVIPQVITNEA